MEGTQPRVQRAQGCQLETTPLIFIDITKPEYGLVAIMAWEACTILLHQLMLYLYTSCLRDYLVRISIIPYYTA